MIRFPSTTTRAEAAALLHDLTPGPAGCPSFTLTATTRSTEPWEEGRAAEAAVTAPGRAALTRSCPRKRPGSTTLVPTCRVCSQNGPRARHGPSSGGPHSTPEATPPPAGQASAGESPGRTDSTTQTGRQPPGPRSHVPFCCYFYQTPNVQNPWETKDTLGKTKPNTPRLARRRRGHFN